MNRILSLVRRCVEDYEMIAPNDRVAVGVSGGKDSLVLITALAKLREFYPIPFEVEAITLDMGHADGRPGIATVITNKYAIFFAIPFAPFLLDQPYDASARSTTLFLMCARKRTPAPCAPKCAGAPCTTP